MPADILSGEPEINRAQPTSRERLQGRPGAFAGSAPRTANDVSANRAMPNRSSIESRRPGATQAPRLDRRDKPDPFAAAATDALLSCSEKASARIAARREKLAARIDRLNAAHSANC